MFSFLLIWIASLATVLAGYAENTQGNAGAGSSSSAGNGVDGSGTGYGYGFSGSTQGAGAGAGFGNFPQPPVFDFNTFLNAYFESLRKYHEQFQSNTNSYAYTSNNANGRAEAKASIIYDGNYVGNNPGSNSLQAAHQNAVSGYGFPGGFPAFSGAGAQPGAGNFAGGFGGSFQGNPEAGGAVASGGIGPDGGFQSAAVYPENPNNPNIFNRFGGAEGEGQGQGQGQGQAAQGQPGGFYGVFTSSHSSSSDMDGKKTQVHEAQTTINDNGKVTTYKVKNP